MQASLAGTRELSSWGSWAPQHRLNNCGTGTQLFQSTRDIPGPGIEAVSPGFTGGFFTGATREAPDYWIFKNRNEATSLGVHWLRLNAPKAGSLRLIPGQETRS